MKCKFQGNYDKNANRPHYLFFSKYVPAIVQQACKYVNTQKHK